MPSLREQFNHWHPIAVRWGDMDAFGHVNNAVYLSYSETARIRYFESMGLMRHLKRMIQGPAIVSATINWREQVYHPANLDVGTRAVKLGTKSFTLEFVVIRHGTEQVVCDGTTIIAAVDYKKNQSIPLPDGLRQAFVDFEGDWLEAG